MANPLQQSTRVETDSSWSTAPFIQAAPTPLLTLSCPALIYANTAPTSHATPNTLYVYVYTELNWASTSNKYLYL